MEYVLIPQKDGTAKRLPIPQEIIDATADRSAVVAYVRNPPKAALDAAETVPMQPTASQRRAEAKKHADAHAAADKKAAADREAALKASVAPYVNHKPATTEQERT